MRLIASRGDVYGPSSGTTVRTTLLEGNPAAPEAGLQSPATAVPVQNLFPQLANSFVAKPITWLVGLVLVLVSYKLIEEKRGGQEKFEEIKLGLNNVWKIGLVAMLFFVIARFLTTAYSIPGFSPFVKYATGGGST